MIRGSRLQTLLFEADARVATALMVSFVALLPAEPLYNIPTILLALLGALRIVLLRVRFGSPENRFLCIAFLCIWLPMLASLPDAVNPVESVRKTLSMCLYFLAAVYVVDAYRRFRDLDWIMTGSVVVCVFWALDALWQFQTGVDWFGITYTEGARLPGVFHTGRIGYTLVSFAPFMLEVVRRLWRRWWWSPVLLVPYLMTIVLAGSRASWLALVIAVAGYVVYVVFWSNSSPSPRRRRNSGRIAAGLSAMMVIGVASTYAWPDNTERMWNAVSPRVESLEGLWSGDRSQFERAVTWRLSIWMTAVNMWSHHWLNGVGPRGFHYAYREYNPDEDYYLSNDGSFGAAKSPHMQLLEIATETGVIGLAGYVGLLLVLSMRLRSLDRKSFGDVWPYALTVIVALFPFSGHLGFYGVFSAGFIWFAIALFSSAIGICVRSESGK